MGRAEYSGLPGDELEAAGGPLCSPAHRYPPHVATLAYISRISRPGSGCHAARPRSAHGAHTAVELCGTWWYPRAPRTPILCRLLVAMIALLVFLQAISCGLFFCVTLPFGHRPYLDYRELMTDAATMAAMGGSSGLPGGQQQQQQQPQQGAGSFGGATAYASAAAAGAGLAGAPDVHSLSAPKLIPRVIHQTFRSKRLPAAAKALMRSWSEQNGDSWQVRFYDDAACVNFVRREFPEYLEAYLSLPKDVERADFFRYMVLLRLGGVYADVDVECRQPLDAVIKPADTLLVGWDAEVADDGAAAARHLVRRRQVLQWFFAAAPGHPVLREACDHIAHNAMTPFSNDTLRDTAERTGRGMWTDLVLKHATAHPAGKHEDPWKVRILPRVSLGVHPAGVDGLTPDLKEIVALHHFLGSWKGGAGGWARAMPLHRRAMEIMSPVLPWFRTEEAPAADEPIRDNGVRLFPVSAAFDPPFHIMTDLVGAGDAQGGADVSAALSAWGTWQPALAPARKPSVAEALVGPLAAKGRGGNGGVLVDVGAGHGFFSLAAASRGHQVIAFEASEASLAAFQASIRYNGFGSLVRVHAIPLGAGTGRVCLRRRRRLVAGSDGVTAAAGTATDAASSEASAASEQQQQQSSQSAANVTLAAGAAALRAARGYAHLHDAEADDAAGDCERDAQRLALSDVLGNDTRVSALRISAHGHEGWVLQGAMRWLETVHRPDVVYMEFSPAAMRAAGYADPLAALRAMQALGYGDIAHAGKVCDARWLNVTNGLRAQGTFTPTAQLALQQPTWCKLRTQHFQLLLDHAQEDVPENVLFVLRAPVPGGVRETGPAKGAAAASASSSSSSSTASTSSSSSSASGSTGKHSDAKQSGDSRRAGSEGTSSSTAATGDSKSSMPSAAGAKQAPGSSLASSQGGSSTAAENGSGSLLQSSSHISSAAANPSTTPGSAAEGTSSTGTLAGR